MLRRHKISELPVVDADGRPVGLLDITDLIGWRSGGGAASRRWPETWRHASDGLALNGTPDAGSCIGDAMQPSSRRLQSAAAPSSCWSLDVDGVLTDGGIVYGDDGAGGEELPRPRRLGAEAVAAGGQARGRDHRPVVAGGRGAGGASWASTPVFQGAADKLPAYRAAAGGGGGCRRSGLLRRRRRARPAAVARLRPGRGGGRRLPRGAGRRPITSPAPPGGRGAVREVIELILRCQGEWDRLAGGSDSGSRRRDVARRAALQASPLTPLARRWR